MSQMEKDVVELNEISRVLYELTKNPEYGAYTWLSALTENMAKMKALLTQVGV
jgi:hypothetical protein